jgi:hypothetical protein
LVVLLINDIFFLFMGGNVIAEWALKVPTKLVVGTEGETEDQGSTHPA